MAFHGFDSHQHDTFGGSDQMCHPGDSLSGGHAMTDPSHLSSTSGHPCTVGGAFQSCNDHALSGAIGGAAGAGAVGMAGGPEVALPAAAGGFVAGGVGGCATGIVEHLGGCF